MKSFFGMFKSSALELKSVRTLTVTAMLCALSVVIEMNAFMVNPTTKVNFAFVALAAVGLLFGPVVGMLAGAVCDIAGFLINPGGYGFNPVYTLIAVMQGLIYGMALYHSFYGKKYEIVLRRVGTGRETDIGMYLRLVVARLADVVVINLFLNTLNLYLMNTAGGGASVGGFFTFLLPRLIKNLVELPVDLILMFTVLPVVMTAYRRVFRLRPQNSLS